MLDIYMEQGKQLNQGGSMKHTSSTMAEIYYYYYYYYYYY